MRQVQDPIIPIVGEMVRNHPGTISLGQGVVYYGPPVNAFEGIKTFLGDPDNHKYRAVEGIAPLRQKLREKLRRENGFFIEKTNGDPNAYQLCVTAGGNMAYFNAVLAVADPGDEIIILSPFYFNHEMATVLAHCKPVIVPTDKHYQPDVNRLEDAITTRTRAVLTVSPNNPTGAVYPESTLRAINGLCREKGLYHIHDEAYEYFVYGEARHFSPGSIEGAYNHTISLFSFSKAYGFASWRIGYMVFPKHLELSIKKIQDTNLICPPVISQYAALGSLEVGNWYCKKHLPEYNEVRMLFQQEMELLEDICRIPKAEGAFYFFLKLRSRMDELHLVERLIKEFGVAAMPGRSFGVEGCYLRVAYGALRKDTAVEGIGRLANGLQHILR
ncbi:pyridoxal phosphate-dependent aminotransferase [bacterium]|nr:pyridoxal phosphate-dependent aminotransferase [bacterium]